jgi:hypothetical protein
VAVGIVDGFEAVDVEKQAGEALLLQRRFAEDRAEMAVEIAPIVQAGQVVGDRELHRGLERAAQGLREAPPPHLRAHPGDQLVAVDRTQQVVVDAEVEAAGDAGPLVHLADHDQRHVAGPLQRAELTAQAQTVESFEVEADQGEIEPAVRRPHQGAMGSLSTVT